MLDVYNLGLGGIERERKHKVLAGMSKLIGAIDSPARQGYPAIAAWPCLAEKSYLAVVVVAFVVELVTVVVSVLDVLVGIGVSGSILGACCVVDDLLATISIDVSA